MSAGCEDCRPNNLTHAVPSYRRALWLVAVMNGVFGVAEITAGVLAGSQSLKADALDFLGDGAITALGLLAIRRGASWRARSALGQAVFLAAMGVGVLSVTVLRTLAPGVPSAETMGVFGAVALVVNLGSALLLIRRRSGDANVRAVWLLSRNDALGNCAVLAAAALVGWTGTPWPDLAVAAVIAGLFLHGSWEIAQHARRELHELRTA